jgi:hypothetical protein
MHTVPEREMGTVVRRKTEAGIRSPCLSDSPEEQADWLELCALQDKDRIASPSDLHRELQVSGSYDAQEYDEEAMSEEVSGGLFDTDGISPSDDRSKDDAEAAVEGAFADIGARARACGTGGSAYPFEVGANHISLADFAESAPYVFLLLLSTFGHDAAPATNDGAKLFEELCAEAARAYLGGQDTAARSTVFGFPRRLLPRSFPAALDALCRDLCEGTSHRDRPRLREQKDAKLDIVAWRPFPDDRPGKLIAFGQCATGIHWQEKLSELRPGDWCKMWMVDAPAVCPVRFFFVPHRVEDKDWVGACIGGGVLFERCRISNLVPAPSRPLADRITAWSRFVLRESLRWHRPMGRGR